MTVCTDDRELILIFIHCKPVERLMFLYFQRADSQLDNYFDRSTIDANIK